MQDILRFFKNLTFNQSRDTLLRDLKTLENTERIEKRGKFYIALVPQVHAKYPQELLHVLGIFHQYKDMFKSFLPLEEYYALEKVSIKTYQEFKKQKNLKKR